MLASPGRVKGVSVRGVEPRSAPAVMKIFAHMTSGGLEGLASGDDPGQAPGVLIGSELAGILGLGPDSRVNMLSPSGQRGPTGFSPRLAPLRVAGIFKTGMFELDSSMAIVDMETARKVFGLAEGGISGFEVMTDDVYRADDVARLINSALPALHARSWKELNANLFAALELERIGMFIVLGMVILIGSFSIVTSLVMLVMEKTRDIAVLMAMGATRRMIRRIFMLQGAIIGLAGTALGYGGGIGLAALLQRYKFVKLPPGVYTIDYLPVILRWEDIALIGASAMILCFLATIYPARQAAGLQPADALRYE
jgi:lipoprotein-releasing system permease protein